jgi:hypothetical protein
LRPHAAGKVIALAIFNRVFEDIELPDIDVWYGEVSDVAGVNVAGNDMTAGPNQPGRGANHNFLRCSI